MKIKVGDILKLGKEREVGRVEEIFNSQNGKLVFRIKHKMGFWFIGYVYDYEDWFLKILLEEAEFEPLRKQLPEAEI